MKIALCEDEKKVANIIYKKIDSILNRMEKDYHIDVFFNGYDLLDCFSQEYDIVFLDICMNGIDGFEVAKRIRKIDSRVLIVFITSVADFVFDGYKLNAFRYLLKNKVDDDIEELLISACDNIATKQCYITIKNKNGYKKILCDEIIYITSSLRKLYIYTTRYQESFYGKICDYEKKLSKYEFIRTHQSFLINPRYIKTLSFNTIVLNDNTVIPISKKRLKYVKEKVVKLFK
jgi:DNA-binding LytR/AlgR family response regulator